MIPNLYPDETLSTLCAALCPVPLERVFEWRVVAVGPLFADDPQLALAGQAFGRLLARDLMGASGLSVLPTDEVPLSAEMGDFQTFGQGPRSGQYQITGVLHDRTLATLWILENGEPAAEIELEADGPALLSLAAASSVLSALGLEPDDALRAKWAQGRPSGWSTLIEHGRLAALPPADREDGLLVLLDQDPSYTLPLHDLVGAQHLARLAAGCARDRSDAHLHFLVYAGLFAQDAEPTVAQGYLRRTLTLAPGYARAHMCAPHLAPDPSELLEHAAVAYQLLPGNGSAIATLIGALQSQGAPPKELVDLAREAIEAQPDNPLGYYFIINLLKAMGAPLDALDYAHELKRVLGDPLCASARYYLAQSPDTADALAAGWDPALQLDETIEEIKAIIDPPVCGCGATQHAH